MSAANVNTNEKGDSAKRRNHTVPKALLKRWLTDNNGVVGHWVLDCSTSQIAFHPGKEATFAISEFRYVPIREPSGQAPYRDETVENWFSTGENDLARITDLLLNQQSRFDENAIGGFIQAAIALGFRSAYEYEAIEQAMVSTGAPLPNDEVARRVVDYFRRMYSLKLKQFSNWDYQIVPSPDPLLVCDRPTFDMTIHRLRKDLFVIPLTPSLMLVATPPSEHGRDSLSFIVSNKTSPKIAALLNQFTVERARQFVVGQLSQLTALQPMFTTQAFQARKAADRLVLQNVPSEPPTT